MVSAVFLVFEIWYLRKFCPQTRTDAWLVLWNDHAAMV